MFNALNIPFMNIHISARYALTLSKVLGIKFDLPKSLDPWDSDFSRKFLRVQAFLASDKDIDYLGPDYGKTDIMNFDAETFKKIMDVNKRVDIFFSECAHKLNIEYSLDFTGGG